MPITVKALVDSGGSGCLWMKRSAQKLRIKTQPATTVFTTMSGSHTCNERVTAQFTLPEFYDDQLIEWDFHLAPDLGNYDGD